MTPPFVVDEAVAAPMFRPTAMANAEPTAPAINSRLFIRMFPEFV
jgi:hypothetical protein